MYYTQTCCPCSENNLARFVLHDDGIRDEDGRVPLHTARDVLMPDDPHKRDIEYGQVSMEAVVRKADGRNPRQHFIAIELNSGRLFKYFYIQ